MIRLCRLLLKSKYVYPSDITNISLSPFSFSVYQTSHYQDGRVVKALDLTSNGRVVRVGSNPTPGKMFSFEEPCEVLTTFRFPLNEFTKTKEL